MIKPGLVSITFRRLPWREVLDLTSQTGLRAIEWGGDVHVPHGDLAIAREVGKATRDEGLAVSSYGSYYRAGESEAEGLSFSSVLESALSLQTPLIRVWAGKRGSVEADEAYRGQVIQDLCRISELAEKESVAVGIEHHGGTLTDNTESAVALYESLPTPTISAYWQPPNGKDKAYCIQDLQTILQRVSNIHVFVWKSGPGDQKLLAEGADRWERYFDVLAGTDADRYALIEFTKDGSVDCFRKDAKTLKTWVNS